MNAMQKSEMPRVEDADAATVVTDLLNEYIFFPKKFTLLQPQPNKSQDLNETEKNLLEILALAVNGEVSTRQKGNILTWSRIALEGKNPITQLEILKKFLAKKD